MPAKVVKKKVVGSKKKPKVKTKTKQYQTQSVKQNCCGSCNNTQIKAKKDWQYPSKGCTCSYDPYGWYPPTFKTPYLKSVW